MDRFIEITDDRISNARDRSVRKFNHLMLNLPLFRAGGGGLCLWFGSLYFTDDRLRDDRVVDRLRDFRVRVGEPPEAHGEGLHQLVGLPRAHDFTPAGEEPGRAREGYPPAAALASDHVPTVAAKCRVLKGRAYAFTGDMHKAADRGHAPLEDFKIWEGGQRASCRQIQMRFEFLN